jgi:hypothetical protein
MGLLTDLFETPVGGDRNPSQAGDILLGQASVDPVLGESRGATTAGLVFAVGVFDPLRDHPPLAFPDRHLPSDDDVVDCV